MTKRPSSTFSSEVELLAPSDRPTGVADLTDLPMWRAGAYVPRAAVLAVGLVMVLELVLRFCVDVPRDAGQFWTDRAEARVLTYRQALVERPPNVVVVGDSLGQCGFDPHAFEKGVRDPALSVYNLSNPGVYLLTTKELVIEPEVLEAAVLPEHLVVAFNMFFSLRQREVGPEVEGVLDSLLARKRRDEVDLLERLFMVENRRVLLRYLRRGTFRADALSLPDKGYFPNRQQGRPEGALAVRSWGPVWPEAETRLVEVLGNSRRHGVRPILLLTPLPEAFVASYADWRDALTHLVKLCTEHSARLVDATRLFDDQPEAASAYFSDWRHLNAAGAERFSEVLGQHWREILQQPTEDNPYVLASR